MKRRRIFHDGREQVLGLGCPGYFACHVSSYYLRDDVTVFPYSGLLVSLAGMVMGVALLGCAPGEGNPQEVPPPDPGSPADASVEADGGIDPTADSDGPIEAELADLSSIMQRVKQTGKPTVVDFWSLACPPCMEEFPGLVQLQNRYPEGVACFAVDLDYDGRKTKPADSYSAEVNAFLQAQEAEFPCYICTTPSDQVYAELKIDSIPSVFVFDAKGNLVKKFVDAGETAGFGYEEEIVPLVKQLVEGLPET